MSSSDEQAKGIVIPPRVMINVTVALLSVGLSRGHIGKRVGGPTGWKKLLAAKSGSKTVEATEARSWHAHPVEVVCQLSTGIARNEATPPRPNKSGLGTKPKSPTWRTGCAHLIPNQRTLAERCSNALTPAANEGASPGCAWISTA